MSTNFSLQPALAARYGRTLRAVGITRISTLNQDPKSLADQQALLTRWVADRFDGPIEWEFIAGQGSGENVDRQQVAEAEELVENGRYDLVVMEDLSRHMRRVHAVLFCELCEDTETRLIAINDDIDTAREWRLHAFFAAMKHEQSNKDTSERIKRSLRNRFMQGEVVQSVVYGYVKPAGTKHDSGLQKDPAAESIYKEWFQRLDDGATYSEIADWLNRLNIPLGPSCRTSEWTGRMVARITRNPILKGVRVRNRMKSRRYNKTGKHRCVKADPEELLERHCPHLAFFDADYYDRVTRKVKLRNAECRPGRPGGNGAGLSRTTKRTIWPGQHIYCGICGRMLCYGGHGQNEHLLCRGAYDYRCWNGITVDGPLAARKISAAVLQTISALPDFDPALMAMVHEEADRYASVRSQHLGDLARTEEKIGHQIENIVAALREGGSSPSLFAELARLESEKDRVKLAQSELDRIPRPSLKIPPMDEIKRLAFDCLDKVSIESPEYGRLMRRWIPRIWVYPYRLIDGGRLVLRASFALTLADILPAGDGLPCLTDGLKSQLCVNLFEVPQRVAFRGQIVALRAEGQSEREAAGALGITVTAAQHASALDRRMKAAGLGDPYVAVSQPPADYTKLRRHLHPRYRFDPSPGHIPEWPI